MSETAEKQPVDIPTVLAMVIQDLSSLAWVKMGLQPDPVAGRIVKDLDQAKLAIDAAADLSGRIEPLLDEEDRRRVQNLIRDLRVNFVSHAGGHS